MAGESRWDAVVIGAGPNGLAAAITMARAGRSVLVLEAKATVGGAARSAPLTLPGFVHDVCSAIYPMAAASPFFNALPLDEHGLEWVHPAAAAGHPFDDGSAAVLERSIEATAVTLGGDGQTYRRFVQPMAEDWPGMVDGLLGPLRWPRHPWAMARFGLRALRSARSLVEATFRGRHARGLWAGMAGHSMLPLERKASAAAGLVLAIAGHVAGWPMPRGGAQRISDAMAVYLRSRGGRIETDRPVQSMRDLPEAGAYLFDVTPRQLAAIAGEELPARHLRALQRYRYGPGVFKVDWALDGPIPWKATACARAGTVHLGGTFDEIAEGERAVWRGEHPRRPFVLLAQHTMFDATRAPAGKHTAWGYCHVPHGSTVDMAEAIEGQIERFAPGFRDLVLARAVLNTAQLQAYNANCIGGDIAGGVQDLGQLFRRPTTMFAPYATPHPRLYLCSSSTPPGGGVHGMCGYHAARLALKRVFKQAAADAPT